MGVNTRESNNLTENSSDFEKCIECTEGRCILHETQKAPVNNLTPSVNQDNYVKSEMIDGWENNILVISDEDHDNNDHTDSANVVCDIKSSFHMASDKYKLQLCLQGNLKQCIVIWLCLHRHGNLKTVHSESVMSTQQSEMVHSESVMLTQQSEMVHSDTVMSTQKSKMVHSESVMLTQTQQTQTVVHSNKKHHIVQCHQNPSVKSNEINEIKSTAFKSCKYHKQLMTIAQTFAEEATDTLTLKYGGVSTNDNLEFAHCLNSSGHELNDIGSHPSRMCKINQTEAF